MIIKFIGTKMRYKIDNPGGGDCGFYAFSIALIDIIKKEYGASGTSHTFNQWFEKGLAGVSVDNILEVDLYQLYRSPSHYKTELLDTLQMSLRCITAKSLQQDLLVKIQTEIESSDTLTKIEGSIVYGKFMELVQASFKGLLTHRTANELGKFNELALSPEVRKLAHTTAKSLQEKLVGKSFAMSQKEENSHVKEIVLQEVIFEGTVNPASVILKGIDRIKERGRWATHSDLQEVASQLNVNLFIVGKINGASLPGNPTVTLNNQRNVHWTTTVDQLKPKLKGKKKTLAEDEENPRASKRARYQKTEFKKESEVLTADSKSKKLIPRRGKEKNTEDKLPVKDLVYASLKQGLFAHIENKKETSKSDDLTFTIR